MSLPEPLPLDESAIADQAARLASSLAGAGDAIAVLAGNTPSHVAARDAVAILGRWFVPIHPRSAPPEIARILAKSGARILVHESTYADLAASACEHASSHVVTRATFDELVRADRESARLSLGARAPVGATILFTSGTTGEPKGCLRAEAQERARAEELIETYSITARDVHLIACPLAHSAPGIFLRACRRAGARTALLERFDAGAFLDAVASTRATLFFLVPTQVERMLALPAERRAAADWSSVRAFIVAGAPFPPSTKRRLLDWIGPGRLWEFYGSSETGTVSVLGPDEQPGHAGLVGTPPPGVELRLLAIAEECGPGGSRAEPPVAARRRVAPGEIGEVFVRSPSVMRGYLGDEGADPTADGFVSVGDLGVLDERGALTLVDRKHDTIISGGVNVYPAEVERALASHPAILGAVVFGLPDPEWGEIVAAVVAARDPVDRDELRSFLRERIAAYKTPRRIEVVTPDELPIGPSGKPLRRAARARFR